MALDLCPTVYTPLADRYRSHLAVYDRSVETCHEVRDEIQYLERRLREAIETQMMAREDFLSRKVRQVLVIEERESLECVYEIYRKQF